MNHVLQQPELMQFERAIHADVQQRAQCASQQTVAGQGDVDIARLCGPARRADGRTACRGAFGKRHRPAEFVGVDVHHHFPFAHRQIDRRAQDGPGGKYLCEVETPLPHNETQPDFGGVSGRIARRRQLTWGAG
jgi:hypothetical protein